MRNLFRPEVIEGRRQGWLGSIQLIRPVSFTVLTALVVLTALAVGSYLAIGEYTRKARISGYLVPDRGVIRLMAPQASTVLERHAVEGQQVRQGDVLFVLSLDRATAEGDAQATVQSTLDARSKSLKLTVQQQTLLQQSQAVALDRQIDDMKRELQQMASEAELQRERVTLGQKALAEWESLQRQNFMSAAQVQAKAEEVLGARAQLQSVERQRIVQQRQITQLEAQRRELPLKASTQQGELERDLAALAQKTAENEALRRVLVRAPQDGIVSAVMIDAGQATNPSTALASMVPADARLQADLFAPSSSVGFVRAEQPVLLRYQAYPYQKFGHQTGHVLRVSRTPLQPSELSSLSLPAGAEPLYRITVALDTQSVRAYGQAQPLSPGMQLDADVLLDRRRLIEWIFEPVWSIAGRV